MASRDRRERSSPVSAKPGAADVGGAFGEAENVDRDAGVGKAAVMSSPSKSSSGELTAEQMKEAASEILERIDENGAWTVASSLSAFALFLLETINMGKFGGWDVIYRDELSWDFVLSMSSISSFEDFLNFLFACEFTLRVWATRDTVLQFMTK